VAELRREKSVLHIGIVGKYVQLEDAYLSVKESLIHAGLNVGWDIDIQWISSEGLEKGRFDDRLQMLDGIVVPGGFGERGIEGKIRAARFARENRLPYLGLCLGMQIMCIEMARDILGQEDANSTEFDISTSYPVIDFMPDQRDIADMGGTMRLGKYDCVLASGSKAATAYQRQGFGPVISERHSHRLSGMSPDGRLVEISEVVDHPYMVGSQFHPEFKSRPTRPHPLFVGLVRAAAARRLAEERAGSAHAPAGDAITG
jgi:CTP synthase